MRRKGRRARKEREEMGERKDSEERTEDVEEEEDSEEEEDVEEEEEDDVVRMWTLNRATRSQLVLIDSRRQFLEGVCASCPT